MNEIVTFFLFDFIYNFYIWLIVLFCIINSNVLIHVSYCRVHLMNESI